jgi:23S rRNA (adenine2503-C2)-methyltransferase
MYKDAKKNQNRDFDIFVFVINSDGKIIISGLDLEQMADLLDDKGIDRKYAKRLLYWVYRKAASSFSEINDIPATVLKALSENFVTGLSESAYSVVSADGSVKYLFYTSAGLPHETVWLPEGRRETVCISVQSGCRMGCRFCATGRNGWGGNLTAGEIVNQVISIPQTFTHVVLMGMGEPGDNITEVVTACKILTAEWGLAAGNSKVTVSTVGVVPSVKRLLEETNVNITLSLHSPFTDERAAVIPAEATWPFRETIKLIKDYGLSRRRRFSVAYVMIKDKNDSGRHLEELKRVLSGTGIRVNLLPYHRTFEQDEISSDDDTMMRFKHLLVTSGIGASVRRSRGADIEAACGMLAGGPGHEAIKN